MLLQDFFSASSSPPGLASRWGQLHIYLLHSLKYKNHENSTKDSSFSIIHQDRPVSKDNPPSASWKSLLTRESWFPRPPSSMGIVRQGVCPRGGWGNGEHDVPSEGMIRRPRHQFRLCLYEAQTVHRETKLSITQLTDLATSIWC